MDVEDDSSVPIEITEEETPILAKLATEFIGTFFLVVTVAISVVTNPFLASFAIGSVLMCFIYAGGSVSGAHYNPAVTIGCMVRGICPVGQGCMYIGVQLLAGILGASIGFGVTETSFAPGAGADYDIGQVFLAEFLYTFALVYCVLYSATSQKVDGNSYFGITIGFVVLVGAITIGDISGCALNPAVATGLSLVHAGNGGDIDDFWLYLITGPLGGVVAALVWKFTHADENAEPLLPQKLLTEALGTLFLVCTVTTSIWTSSFYMISVSDYESSAEVAPGSHLAAFAIGSILMCFIYAGGHVSGAHYNPAVTIGCLVRGVAEPLDAGLYIATQLFAGWLGAVLGYILTENTTAPAAGADYNVGQAFLVELLYTFALVYNVLYTATSNKNEGNSFFGMAIGFTVTVGALAVGGVSGGAFNPAVATGMSLVHVANDGDISDFWIYWITGPLGGVLAGIVFKLTHPNEIIN